MFLLKRFDRILIAILSTSLLSTLSAKSNVLEVPARYPAIQAAIDAAANGDTVLVAPGTYYENIDYHNKQISVGSYFLTTGDTSFVSRTVLNGNQKSSVVRIYFNHQDGAMAVLSGVTVTNGKASRGGGIYILDSNAKLDHLVVTDNMVDSTGSLSFQGGGILFESVNYQSKLILTHSVISGNTVSQRGGGICLSEWVDAEFHDVLISSNTADLSGGGLSILGQGVIGSTTVAFDHVEIRDNHASEGGGVYCLGASAKNDLRELIVHGNTASNAGGGLYLAFSILENATVFGNTAPKGSGVHCSSTTIIKNSILWNSGTSEISFGAYGVRDTLSISYTDIRGGNNAVITDNVGIMKWLQGNFNLDPRFIDPAKGDFHLAEDSPCIDAGDPASDYSNEPHYNGKRIDVGAYGNTIEATPSSPRIDIIRQDLDFVKVYFGTTKSEQFTIRNPGKSRLNLELGQLSDGFSILLNTAFSILGGDSSIVEVQFAPVRTGPDSSILVISSNDELAPANEVTLKGFGLLGGQVTGILRAKYSPFLVSENLMVVSGQSWTIEPGVTVLADSGISIIVRGTLIAEGSETDSITFASALSKPYPGGWKGLRFEYGGHTPGSRIQYCRFLHADEAVRLYFEYPLDVRHSYFAKCRSWGIYQDGDSPGTFEHNTFADLNGGIGVSMSTALIRQNHFEHAKTGVRIFGTATISDNTFKNVQCGVHAFESSRSVVRNNKFSGTNLSMNGTLNGIRLRYLENHPPEALNAKYGAVVTGGGFADAYLINLNEFGDPNRDGVLLSTSSFGETVSIPKEGYAKSVRLDDYRPIVLRAKDGGHAKLMVIGTGAIAGTNYGFRAFRYVYVPAGVDSFPRVSLQDYSDGIVVESGAIKVSGNEITNFAGKGISFQNADVDSFVNNRIFGNGDTGVLFHGPSFFRDEEIVFKAGNDPSQFNDVFNNGKFDFVNGTQTSLRLPYFYWGTTDSNQVATRILDGNDYPELGVVNFSPFLDAAHDPVSEVDEKEPEIARNFRLKGIHPNPFRKQVSASFEIGRLVPVTIRVFNLLGQEIKTITQQKFIPGIYEVNWDGRDQRGSQVATGVYLFEFSVENQRITKRILRIN